jgi:hypothetical protein
VLLEMEQAPCADLFMSRSAAALKFLATVNQGLIAAVRGADRRLLRLQSSGATDSETDVRSLADGIPIADLVAAESGV